MAAAPQALSASPTTARSSSMTNPFSQPTGSSLPSSISSAAPLAAPLASWSSATPASSVPISSSQTASFVSATQQFSRKKARHIPLEQQRTALLTTLARSNAGAHSSSQYSAAGITPSFSSSASSSKLVGTHKRKQFSGSRSRVGGDETPMGKFEAEKEAMMNATLSTGQQSVVDAVRAGKSVFFTGCAGTGKSFLLSYLKHSLPSDTTYFTASTGLAAVNISGQTLHSFAGVGLGEADAQDLMQRVQVQQHARRRWQSCQILVVDEISMIDKSLFDKLEYIARTIRRNPLPFGGIQLILTGDFLQLPPVKNTGFVFESRSWGECVPVTIELQSVFRQGDSSLVSILNQFRRGIVDRVAAAAMQECINRKFDTSDGIEATELYSRKAQVNEENDDRLDKLDAAAVEYTALDKGTATYLDQLIRSCNAVERLVLKEGAQVMLLKNLNSALVNGSRGVVIGFDTQEAEDMQSEHRRVSPSGRWPRVKFTNGSEMTLLPERWDVEVSQKSVASRTQVPLMLAWSLTVHKCQGMTLDRVSLHLGSIFEYGQAYVALSRIRSLQSLSIKDKFPQHVIKAHPKAIKFYDDLHRQNGHSSNAVPAQPPNPAVPAQTSPPVTTASTFASNVPSHIHDPYDDMDADNNDDLIAIARSAADEADSSAAAERVPPTFTEQDSMLSPASSFSSPSPFMRASTLSLTQPSSSPSRTTSLQHSFFGSASSSSATTPPSTSSDDKKPQPSLTAATVRRQQLLLKKKVKPEESRPATPATPATTEKRFSFTQPSVSTRGRKDDEIDLVSDDDESTTPPPHLDAVNSTLSEQREAALQQPSDDTHLSPLTARKPSAHSRSNGQPAHPPTTPPLSVQPPALTADTYSTMTKMEEEVASVQQPVPPLHSARCSAHYMPLVTHVEWDKENDPQTCATKVDSDEQLKRAPRAAEMGAAAQWLYRCEKGCRFSVHVDA